MRCYSRIGTALLCLASAGLIGAAIYLHGRFTPPTASLVPEVLPWPPVSTPAMVVFVVAEHLLVGGGLWCLLRGASHGERSGPDS